MCILYCHIINIINNIERSKQVDLNMENKKLKPTISSLLETISKIKIEHQRTLFNLNKKIEKLTADLSMANEKNIESQNTIESLQNEKKELIVQIEQLKLQVHQTGKQTKNTNYVVDKIIDEKMVGRKKYYLVRWKGYGEDDDTWEPKNNLNCPYAMDEYEELKKKNKKK